MKKILSLAIAVCMIFSCAPVIGSEAYAAHMKVGAGSAVISNDSLTEAKGLMKEVVEETYEEYIKDEAFYCKEIWDEIQSCYDNCMKYIGEAKSVKDLYSSDGFFLELAPELDEEVALMAKFGGLIKHYVNKKSDLKVMKRDLKKDIKLIKSQLSRDDFNYFYWGKVQNLFYDSNVALKKINSFRDYMLLADEIYSNLASATSAISPDWILSISFTSEDDSILIPISGSDDEDDMLGFFILDMDEPDDPIYNNAQVEAARVEVVEKLNICADKQIAPQVGDAEAAKVRTAVEKFKKNTLDDIEDVDAIYAAGDKKIKSYVKKYGITVQDVTMADFVKTAKEFNALTSRYSERDYSKMKWMMVEASFQTARSIIMDATKMYELDGVIDNLKEELKMVPKVKKEFKDTLRSSKKNLKDYSSKKNRKKYSQGKVKTVIKNGFAALDKVEKYDVELLEETAAAYMEKAEKCIKKFRIKTSKKGKGSITKTRKVAYGKKCTIKITPKAGYKIKKVRIDGKRKKLKNKYVFKNVKKSHKVYVVFGK